jgi:hypothetical protein
MDQKFIVNGVSYDGLESMPPDVRRQYELAMELLKNVKQEGVSKEASNRTVERSPHGVSIKVEKRELLYNVDGKIFDDASQLPADIRAKLDQAHVKIEPGRDVNVMKVVIDNRQADGGNTLWLWVGIAAAVVIALSFLF